MVRIKSQLRVKAISLRNSGKTYSEILSQIHVAKSTLSLWLRDVGLVKKQIQRITEKRVLARKRGAEKVHQMRVGRELKTFDSAKGEVSRLIKDPLWLAGVILYWAEGAKQKKWSVSTSVKFSNMDPEAHRIIFKWLKMYCDMRPTDFYFEIYIHQTANQSKAVTFWSTCLSVSKSYFRVYLKKGRAKTLRHNNGENYYGVLRTCVRKSTDLNRRIAGWTIGVIKFLSN
jgi:hypothetical protein